MNSRKVIWPPIVKEKLRNLTDCKSFHTYNGPIRVSFFMSTRRGIVHLELDLL